MKKLLLGIVVVAAFTATNAQEMKDAHAERFQKYKAELNLNEEQVNKLEALMKERKGEMMEWKKEREVAKLKTEEGRASLKEKKMLSNEKFEKGFKQMLTKEQLLKLDDLKREERKAKMKMRQEKHSLHKEEMPHKHKAGEKHAH